jgi:CRISPR-associated exonuclease Cas4
MVENNEGVIPVEVKSGRLKAAPYDSHIYQLAAYCLLIDQTFGIRPPFGIIHYSNRDIAVDYTKELEQSVIDLIREIRSQSRRRGLDRSHQSANRCHGCGYNSVCDQSLM